MNQDIWWMVRTVHTLHHEPSDICFSTWNSELLWGCQNTEVGITIDWHHLKSPNIPELVCSGPFLICKLLQPLRHLDNRLIWSIFDFFQTQNISGVMRPLTPHDFAVHSVNRIVQSVHTVCHELWAWAASLPMLMVRSVHTLCHEPLRHEPQLLLYLC